MSTGKRRTTYWSCGVALLLPVLACLGTALMAYQRVPKLPGALETMNIQNLTQVVVPGSADIYFPKAGAYAVYYEYRSVVDGAIYVGGEYPPRLNCQLKSKGTGADVELVSNHVEGNLYATQNRERVGRMIKTISIDQPGLYVFSCQYPHDSTAPEVVLAVGPNIIWEFFNMAAKPLAAIVCGAAVFTGALGVSILIIGIQVSERRRSERSDR